MQNQSKPCFVFSSAASFDTTAARESAYLLSTLPLTVALIEKPTDNTRDSLMKQLACDVVTVLQSRHALLHTNTDSREDAEMEEEDESKETAKKGKAKGNKGGYQSGKE